MSELPIQERIAREMPDAQPPTTYLAAERIFAGDFVFVGSDGRLHAVIHQEERDRRKEMDLKPASYHPK